MRHILDKSNTWCRSFGSWIYQQGKVAELGIPDEISMELIPLLMASSIHVILPIPPFLAFEIGFQLSWIVEIPWWWPLPFALLVDNSASFSDLSFSSRAFAPLVGGTLIWRTDSLNLLLGHQRTSFELRIGAPLSPLSLRLCISTLLALTTAGKKIMGGLNSSCKASSVSGRLAIVS